MPLALLDVKGHRELANKLNSQFSDLLEQGSRKRKRSTVAQKKSSSIKKSKPRRCSSSKQTASPQDESGRALLAQLTRQYALKAQQVGEKKLAEVSSTRIDSMMKNSVVTLVKKVVCEPRAVGRRLIESTAHLSRRTCAGAISQSARSARR
jgi:hypothetical protein